MNIHNLKIYRLFSIVLLIVMFFFILPADHPAEGKSILEELEEEESDDYYGDDDDESSLEYELNGFVELENMVNTYKDQEPRDANKKNEFRNNTNFVFTGELFTFKLVTNIYFNANIIHQLKGRDEYEIPVSDITLEDLKKQKESDYLNRDYVYAEDFQVSRNLRISDNGYEINFRELYLSMGTDLLRLRAGNQIYGWGTADMTNPTSYFNPQDGRELLFRDEDEVRMAVPSLSLLIFLGGGSLELVYVPQHVPMAQAPEGNFWSTNYEKLPFPVLIEEADPLDFDSFNYAYGGRLAFSYWGSDMSFSGYHGPDPEPLSRPMSLFMDTNSVPNQPVGLLIKNEYHISNYLGFDFSTTFNKFVLQLEAAYSPDRIGIALPGGMEFEELREITDIGELEIYLPFFLTRSNYISYSAGINYFVPLNRIIEGHEGESVLIVEWHDARFFEYNNSSKFKFRSTPGMLQPQMSNLLITGFRDSYFSSRLSVTLAAIFDTEYKSQAFLPQIGIDFQNGFTIDFTYGHFRDPNRKKDEMPASLFGFFVDKNVVVMKMRYRY